MEYTLTIHTLSPLCLGSGKADVNVDADIVHDKYGLPYFPGKRLRGLLYESALETVEMAEMCGHAFISRQSVEELFHHCETSPVRLIVPDLQLKDYEEMAKEWQYLEEAYPDIIRPKTVLETYSSIRFQTALDENGLARDTSLRNIRVLDKGLDFTGELTVEEGKPQHIQALALACSNLRRAGLNRNRGFGQVQCTLNNQKKILDEIFQKGGK